MLLLLGGLMLLVVVLLCVVDKVFENDDTPASTPGRSSSSKDKPAPTMPLIGSTPSTPSSPTGMRTSSASDSNPLPASTAVDTGSSSNAIQTPSQWTPPTNTKHTIKKAAEADNKSSDTVRTTENTTSRAGRHHSNNNINNLPPNT